VAYVGEELALGPVRGVRRLFRGAQLGLFPLLSRNVADDVERGRAPVAIGRIGPGGGGSSTSEREYVSYKRTDLG